jgi:hypothetical protein
VVKSNFMFYDGFGETFILLNRVRSLCASAMKRKG